MEFEDLNDVNNYINKDKEDELEIIAEPTIGEIINAYQNIGFQDHVYAFNDSAHSLDNISDELKNKKLSEVTEDDEDEVNNIIEICESIAQDNERELTDDDLEEIRDDKMYRGENPDEI
ncbi:hypothetical protein ACOTVS_09880 [Aliarcobacter butzleri]